MLDKDRGTYSPPTEDNLSYETRRTASRDQAPLTLIISGIVLVVVLLAAVLFYNTGLSNRNHVPAEVGDTVGDFKDEKVQDAKVLSDADLNAADDSQAKFAPDSEAPQLRDSATSETNIAPPPAAPIAGPLPSQVGKTDAGDDETPVPGAPTPKPAASSAAPAASAAPVAATGTTSVQIGAFNSQEQANAEYAKVASSYGLFVGGAGKKVEKVETDKGTFYRTAFTGLSADKAKSFCSALKAAGRDCIVR